VGTLAANLPASALRVIQPGGPAIALSNTGQRLVSEGGGDASYVFALGLVVPEGTAIGTYTTTVTISTTAAP
jgi:hypothetical protein